MEGYKQVEITEKDYKKLKKMYENSVKNNEEQFVFMGSVLLTTYAKYLIMHIENQTGWGKK